MAVPAEIIFKNCTFSASSSVDRKAAIDIDTRFGSFNVEIENCSANGFSNVTEPGGLTIIPGFIHLKATDKGSLTVTVDGEQVYSLVPVTEVSLDKAEIILVADDDEEEPEELDISPIDAAIEAAKVAKEGITVSEDGTDVPAGTYWVAQADMDALDEAIAAAEAAKESAETQQDVAEAVEALEAAVSTFNDAKQEVIDEEEIGAPEEGEEPVQGEEPADDEESVEDEEAVEGEEQEE